MKSPHLLFLCLLLISCTHDSSKTNIEETHIIPVINSNNQSIEKFQFQPIVVDYWNSQISLFYDKNEIPFTWLDVGDLYSWQLFENLIYDKYTIQFSSVFGDILEKEISINNFHPSDFEKELRQYYSIFELNQTLSKTFISLDSFSMAYSSQGCFGGKFTTILEVNKKNEKVFISRKDKDETTELSIIDFDDFLTEAGHFREKFNYSLCTFYELYSFKKDNNIYTLFDNTCEWNGIRHLLKSDITY